LEGVATLGSHRFDALIITALLDELEPVLAYGEGGRGAWTTHKDPDGFPYHYRELPREADGQPLRIAAASFDEMGETATAGRAAALVKHLDPACLAMCGICAGKKADVTLGDVIVADRVYSYDHGKILAKREEDGSRSEELYHDIKTFNLKEAWRVDAAYFTRDLSWTADLVKSRPLSRETQERWLLRTLLEHEQHGTPAPDAHPEREACCPALDALWDRLRLPEHGLLVKTRGVLALTEEGRGIAIELARKYPKGLPKDRAFKIHVGPIATGKVVRKDPELFGDLEKLVRKTMGAEMEAAAIGAIGAQLHRQALIVKAVSDYGDGDKDDAFREFATRASAQVLLRLLLRNLEPSTVEETEEPGLHGSGSLPSSRVELVRGDDLLSRVKTVAELRARAHAPGETLEIRRFRTRPPIGGYLQVSRAQGPFTSQFPIAAVEQATPEVLDAFLAEVDARYRRADPGVRSTLVYSGAPPQAGVLTKAVEKRVLLQSFTQYQGLIDFTGYLDRQIDRLAKDPIYPPELYIEQRAVLSPGDGELETADALSDLTRLLDSPHGRFVLVLGDFGTGKTFMLHELARRLSLARGPVTPVLIELRAIEKAPQLDALISQHLAQAGMDRIDLPAFRYMLSEGRIALLFDGFDELVLRVSSYERAVEHFATLLQAAQGEAKVVITSRTQHFYSDDQVKLELARQASTTRGYRLLKLQRFDQRQIQRFLVHLLGSEDKARQRFHLLDNVQDLMGLSGNPRMLGFIADIPEKDLLEAQKRNKTITSAGLYEFLIRRWLDHEFKRAHPKGALPGLTVEQRWKAATELALVLWRRAGHCVNINELPPELTSAVAELAKHELDSAGVTHQIGSGTLLVRDDESNFSFIHQSVLEWFVSWTVAQSITQQAPAVALEKQEISALMADFIWGLAGRDETERWARSMIASKAAGTLGKNAVLLLQRLEVKLQGTLSFKGQDLSGQDFSKQNLRGADFTDANLTGASFAGADLTGTSLVRAKLRRADLSEAALDQADLREADLSEARLFKTRAIGAQLAGATLREAKLVQARFDPVALAIAEQSGAALPEKHLPAPMVSAVSPCFAVAVSPDGTLLASGHDSSIRIWHLETGTERRTLSGHQGAVRSVAFSPDGKTLASGSDDASVRLWEVASGSERRVLMGHLFSVWSVAFSPDSKTLASGSVDTTVRLWEVASGSEHRVLKGHSQRVFSVAFSPDGKTLASGSDDASVRLWEVASSSERRVLKGHSQRVLSVAFSPDGKMLASGSEDATVRLWEVASGSERRILKGHLFSVWSVAFSPDGKTLASGSVDDTVRLWEVASGSERCVLKGHSHSVRSVAFFPDGKMLASGSADATVRLWEVASGSERRILKGHSQSVLCVAFSPDGKTLASGSEDDTVRLWEVASGSERRVLKGHSQSVLCVAFSPDGKMLASGSADDTVRLWEVASGSERRVLKGHSFSVLCVAFSPDGKTLASGSEDNAVRLWEVASGSEYRVLKGHSQRVRSVAFSPDGKTLASGSEDNAVRLWEVASGSERRVLMGHLFSVLCVAFSPDGKTLASGSVDTTVRLWEVASGSERRVLMGHSQRVWCVAFSPDGKTLASGSEDDTVRLWEVASGSERRVLIGHSHSVRNVAFSPDGKTLASSSTDGTVRLWNSLTGACFAVLVSLDEGWVAFTPEGRYQFQGTLGGAFWHAVGLCRFEPGELDPYLSPPLRVPDGELLYSLPG
jgi:WD40 repeat protein/nucleoside phosphorylase